MRRLAPTLYVPGSTEPAGRLSGLIPVRISRLIVGSILLSLSPHALAEPLHGAIERYEHQSETMQQLQEEVTSLSIEPVIAALKRATKNDPKMQALLSRVRCTASLHLLRPANAYATRELRSSRGGTVEVDLGWFLQADSAAYLEGLRLIDPQNERQLAYRVGFEYGQKCGRALAEGSTLPNFSFVLEDYVPDPLERSFVQGLGKRLTDEAMAWTVLHELAHHKLGHLLPKYRNASKATSRQMELDADAWASRKMVECNMPLYGVMVFMSAMIMIDQIYDHAGLSVPEEDSSHPSWERRVGQLQRSHDPLAATKDNWLMFRAPVNLASAGDEADIKRITYFFPRDPMELGVCLGGVGLGDQKEFAVAERQDQGVHLYQVTLDELVDVHIVKPDRTFTLVVTTVTNRATGEKTEGNLLAWQQPMALYGEIETEGIRAADAMEASQKALYRKALKKLVSNPATRRSVMASLERKLITDCQIVIDYGKGKVDMQEMLSRSQAMEATHVNELKSILGEAGYARLRSQLLTDPLVQKGLQFGDKIMPRSR